MTILVQCSMGCIEMRDSYCTSHSLRSDFINFVKKKKPKRFLCNVSKLIIRRSCKRHLIEGEKCFSMVIDGCFKTIRVEFFVRKNHYCILYRVFLFLFCLLPQYIDSNDKMVTLAIQMSSSGVFSVIRKLWIAYRFDVVQFVKNGLERKQIFDDVYGDDKWKRTMPWVHVRQIPRFGHATPTANPRRRVRERIWNRKAGLKRTEYVGLVFIPRESKVSITKRVRFLTFSKFYT